MRSILTARRVDAPAEDVFRSTLGT
jgi:hypothetical protein